MIGDADSLDLYKEFCERRNPALEDCADGNIVPRSDALGCGCGVCVEDACTVETRYYYYYDRDARARKCKRIRCRLAEVREIASYDGSDSALIGLTNAVEYVNYIRNVDEEDVDITYCTTVTDDETPSPTVADTGT